MLVDLTATFLSLKKNLSHFCLEFNSFIALRNKISDGLQTD